MILDKKLDHRWTDEDKNLLTQFYELTNVEQYPPQIRTVVLFEVEDFFRFLYLRKKIKNE